MVNSPRRSKTGRFISKVEDHSTLYSVSVSVSVWFCPLKERIVDVYIAGEAWRRTFCQSVC